MMKSDNEILLERARKNAQKINIKDNAQEERISLVSFSLYTIQFAIEEKHVSEVLFLREITQIPGTPSFVMGVINYNSKILSVLNIGSFFNIREKGLTDLNKVIVISNGETYFGIIADSILGIRNEKKNSISQPPVNLESGESEFISGILPDGLIIINANKMLTSSKIIIRQ